MWGGQLKHIGVCIWGRSSFLHRMRLYGRHLSTNSPVKMRYHLFQSIQTKSPNTSFVLYTGLVKNPLISPRFWNSVLDKYAIGNFCFAILITPIKMIPCFHNYLSAGTDTKYESVKTILSVLAHGIKSSFIPFLP